MFIAQLAAALSVFAILMGFGAEKAIQYAQAKLPYSTAQRVVQATNFVGNAANSYYNQNCTSGTCPSGLNYPRVQDLVAAGYLPSGNGYSSCNCYTTKDGSRIQLVSGAAAGTFGMTITPGAMLASKPAYTSMLVSRIPGSRLSGNTISVSQPVPALANLGGQFVKVNPAGAQSGNANITGQLTAQGGVNTGTIYTNNQPVNSGQINANGPINSNNAVTATGDTTLWHGVIWTLFAPPMYGANGNITGYAPYGWWPAPSYWWYNTPGYSGCGGQNPTAGVHMPWGNYQTWTNGSCYSGPRSVPGGPYGW